MNNSQESLEEYYKRIEEERPKRKINFTQVGETQERILNGTRESWETHKVAKYIVKRAQLLLDKEQLETFILDTSLSDSTITFCYAIGWADFHPKDSPELIWNHCLESAWFMMLEALEIESLRVRYIKT